MLKYLLAFLLLPSLLYAQNITGTISDAQDNPLPGASVYLLDTTVGTIADADGKFSLSAAAGDVLVVSFIGYAADTLQVDNPQNLRIVLSEAETLEEVIISDRRDGTIISDRSAAKIETITQTELRKAACCDLAGCFETQTTVQAQTTNVITNAKELRIAGLAGVYNQVLIDGFPMIQGLSYTYGISSVPGPLVKNIYVAKGANSVLQGYESISGQINVITLNPDPQEKLFLNGYINSFSEKQFNAHTSFKLGKGSNIAAFHTVQPARRIDRDEDTFTDVPLLTRYVFWDKFKLGKPEDWGWSSEIGVRFLHEQRVGGQTNFDPERHAGSTEVYGQAVTLNQPEIWSKTSYRFNDTHGYTAYVSGFRQQQNSYFGTVKYDAEQTNLYAKLQYEYNYGTQHWLKTGVSFRSLDLTENVDFTAPEPVRTYAGDYVRNEKIPGVFAENSLSLFQDKLTWITGVRADFHNQFGTFVTPRSVLKYDLTDQTVLRANVGTGWRTVNLFSENIGLLISSRDIVFAEDLRPEQAFNSGINITHKYETQQTSGYLSADFFRTDFQNQIFPDYDADPTRAVIANYTGISVSNGFQAEAFIKINKILEFKAGYNYLDVYRETDGERLQLPFNSKHKLLGTFGYRPLSDKFKFDVNAHWYGARRLPNTRSNPVEFQRPDFSRPYALLNAQFTYNFPQIELYAGCENIFDFRQERPIISWENPFGRYFDTSSVWGPTRGREFYLGVRYRLKGE